MNSAAIAPSLSTNPFDSGSSLDSNRKSSYTSSPAPAVSLGSHEFKSQVSIDLPEGTGSFSLDGGGGGGGATTTTTTTKNPNTLSPDSPRLAGVNNNIQGSSPATSTTRRRRLIRGESLAIHQVKPKHDDKVEEIDIPVDIPDAPGCCHSCINSAIIQWLKYILFESIWIYLSLLGFVCALEASFVDAMSMSLKDWHVKLAAVSPNVIGMLFMWFFYPVCLVVTAVAVTEHLSEAAIGSGIPEMKSILTGFSIPGFLTAPTLFAKLIGLSLSRGSGLFIGSEGPFVTMACVAAIILLRLPVFRHIRHSSTLTKHMLGAACAAGVSSAFGAPIGGVLFSVEVTNTVYMTTHHGKGVFCSVMGAFAFLWLSGIRDVVSAGLTGTITSQQTSIFATHFSPRPYQQWELLIFVVVAIFGGLLGGTVNLLYAALVRFKRRNSKKWYLLRPYPFAVIVTLITAWVSIPTGNLKEYVPMRRYYPGGNLFELDPITIITDMFSDTELIHRGNGPAYYAPNLYLNLALFILVKLFLAVVSQSLPVPNGIFFPILVVGAVSGRFFGEIMNLISPQFLPGGYAVVGAAALTAGCTGTVSTGIILLEITGQMTYMVPILIAVTIGRATGRTLSRDIYSCQGMASHLPSLPELTFQDSHGIRVENIMQKNAKTLPRFITFDELVSFLNDSNLADDSINNVTPEAATAMDLNNTIIDKREWIDPYYLYPVTDRMGVFLGSVSRMELASLLNRMVERRAENLTSSEFEVVDVTKACKTDGVSVSMPKGTCLGDAIVLFEVHKTNCIFVSNHRRVIGRLDLRHLIKLSNANLI